ATDTYVFLQRVIVIFYGALDGFLVGLRHASASRHHYPRWLLLEACIILLVSNVFNIAADLGGMAEAAAMLTGLPAVPLLVLFGIGITLITVYTSYATFARYLKWLTSVLFAYIIAAFLAHPDWSAVLRATFVPSLKWNSAAVATLVGFLGTSISPYLFFCQLLQD